MWSKFVEIIYHHPRKWLVIYGFYIRWKLLHGCNHLKKKILEPANVANVSHINKSKSGKRLRKKTE